MIKAKTKEKVIIKYNTQPQISTLGYIFGKHFYLHIDT